MSSWQAYRDDIEWLQASSYHNCSRGTLFGTHFFIHSINLLGVDSEKLVGFGALFFSLCTVTAPSAGVWRGARGPSAFWQLDAKRGAPIRSGKLRGAGHDEHTRLTHALGGPTVTEWSRRHQRRRIGFDFGARGSLGQCEWGKTVRAEEEEARSAVVARPSRWWAKSHGGAPGACRGWTKLHPEGRLRPTGRAWPGSGNDPNSAPTSPQNFNRCSC